MIDRKSQASFWLRLLAWGLILAGFSWITFSAVRLVMQGRTGPYYSCAAVGPYVPPEFQGDRTISTREAREVWTRECGKMRDALDVNRAETFGWTLQQHISGLVAAIAMLAGAVLLEISDRMRRTNAPAIESNATSG
jgi:hypothetical protein